MSNSKTIVLRLVAVGILLATGCGHDSPAGPADAALSSAKEISSFGFAAADNAALPADVAAEINGTDVVAVVPAGVPLTALVPAISMTGVSVDPESGVGLDFTSPITYTVTAEDTTTQTYTVVLTEGAPLAATGVTATTSDLAAVVSWDGVAGATSYNLYWSTTSGEGTAGTLVSLNQPHFPHRGLTNGTPYYYVVTAVNAAGESPASDEVTATPQQILLSGLTFPDAALQACVQAAGSDVGTLTRLSCKIVGIVDLDGIEQLVNLDSLDLSSNAITDISALSGMTLLTNLNLSSNAITDISALSGMTLLTNLNLSSNAITDISALSGMTLLTNLNLRNNTITDISALPGMAPLTRLNLGSNTITDISGLAEMTLLTFLNLGDNSISDVSPLSGMTLLTSVSLGSNSISDVTPLSGMTSLFYLDLHFNTISNVSALSGMTSLIYLLLGTNTITDISVLSGMTLLTELDLDTNTVTDVSDLAGLTLLETVQLSLNAVTTGVATLVSLTDATSISLDSNATLPCTDVETLDDTLDSGNGSAAGIVTWTLCI